MTEDSNPATLFDTICRLASEHEASDILLHENQPVLLRIHGDLVPVNELVLQASDFEWFRQVINAPKDALDFDGSYSVQDGDRFRVNILRQLGAHAAILRRIRATIPEMEALGLPVEMLRGWLASSHGIILISGRTGSGKSTTLASCLDWLNHHQRKHIVTIEDPVEYIFHSDQSIFTQREVGIDTDSFAQGLKRSLRQCPDVIMVGEIRDFETATIALQAAETGHLVLATLHASSCAEILERVLNLFPVEQREGLLRIFAQCLVGAICQNLIPTVDGSLALACEYFSNQGLAPKLIAEGKVPELADFIQRSDKETAKRYIDSLAELCNQGRVDKETALRFAPEPQELQRILQGINTGSGASRRA